MKAKVSQLCNCIFSGITRFQLAYNVTFEQKPSQYPLRDIDDISTESQSFDILTHDGMKLDIQVRASDITGAFTDDFVTVKTDLSSPVIEDLWLTTEGGLNISVHNVEDPAKIQYVSFSAYNITDGNTLYMCIPAILANNLIELDTPGRFSALLTMMATLRLRPSKHQALLKMD